MTATVETTGETNSIEANTDNTSSTCHSIPKEIMNIMEFLSQSSKIIFKSQQRNEPELDQAEKLKLALDVYQRNPQTFLIRFGHYLEERHLQDFARLSIADSDEELHLLVKDYENKLKTRLRDVKNRRFTALQKLIKDGEYFSEQEMMKRQPELYQELVGQYLSNEEKLKRDSYDVRNTTFSGILIHNLEREQLNVIMEKAQNYIEETPTNQQNRDTDKKVLDNLEKEDEIPLNCRQQWGNFDNEQVACSSSKLQTKKSAVNKIKTTIPELIMADERELLRQEFISQMHEQFLTGQDKDFDYSAVDDNTQFDDLKLINQDKEDEYFEESEDDSAILSSHKVEDGNDESEDDLDTYMYHLNKHHSLKM